MDTGVYFRTDVSVSLDRQWVKEPFDVASGEPACSEEGPISNDEISRPKRKS